MSFRPLTDDEIVAALLNAEDLAAEGKSLTDIAADFDVREETLRRWQIEYADLVAEERARRDALSADKAEQDGLTQKAWYLLFGVMAVIVIAAGVQFFVSADAALRTGIAAALSLGAAASTYFSLQRGDFPAAGRHGQVQKIRRRGNSVLFWFFYW